MWKLTSLTEDVVGVAKDGSIYLIEQRKYSVGRKDPSLDISINDISVSKAHATFELKDQKLFLVDGSKLGSAINGQKATPNKAVEVRSGDIIKFGTGKTEFNIEFIPLALCLTSFPVAEKEKILQVAKTKNIKITEDPMEATQLVTPLVQLTPKVLVGLLRALPIVSTSFFDAIANRKSIVDALPDPSKMFPALGVENYKQLEFASNESRIDFFAGKVFVFSTQAQLDKMKQVIEAGRGRLVLWSHTTKSKSKVFVDEHWNAFFIDPEDNKDAKKFLSEANVRFNTSTDILTSIIKCDIKILKTAFDEKPANENEEIEMLSQQITLGGRKRKRDADSQSQSQAEVLSQPSNKKSKIEANKPLEKVIEKAVEKTVESDVPIKQRRGRPPKESQTIKMDEEDEKNLESDKKIIEERKKIAIKSNVVEKQDTKKPSIAIDLDNDEPVRKSVEPPPKDRTIQNRKDPLRDVPKDIPAKQSLPKSIALDLSDDEKPYSTTKSPEKKAETPKRGTKRPREEEKVEEPTIDRIVFEKKSEAPQTTAPSTKSETSPEDTLSSPTRRVIAVIPGRGARAKSESDSALPPPAKKMRIDVDEEVPSEGMPVVTEIVKPVVVKENLLRDAEPTAPKKFKKQVYMPTNPIERATMKEEVSTMKDQALLRQALDAMDAEATSKKRGEDDWETASDAPNKKRGRSYSAPPSKKS